MIPPLRFDIDPDDVFLKEFEGVGTVTVGVVSYGDAAAYALVWEFGNVRQTKQGPKTVRGINLLTGESVWLTIQAPTGYIRVNEQEYWNILHRCFDELTFSGTTSDEIRKEIEGAAYKAARLIAEVVRDAAPIGEGYYGSPGVGALRASILAVPPGDESLDEEELFEGATLQVDYPE